MPYQLVSAKARTKGLDAMWSDVDLSTMKIGTVLSTYVSIWLTLSHNALTANVYLDLALVRDELAAQHHSKTIAEWLVINGDDTLPTVNYRPELRLRRVICSDAWRAGYSIEPVDIYRNPNAEIPFSEKNDLLLSREGVDFQVNWRYCMVSVNGYFHRVGGSPQGLQVLEGGRTGRIGNDSQVTVHSFREVGTLTYVPITPSMIYKTAPNQKLADYAYIQLPENVENKTVLLVLGGYLHVLDNAYKMVGERTMRVDFNNYELLARLYDSEQYIDLSSLPLTRNEDSPGHYVVDEVLSDEVLTAYMCLPQSFIVLVDTKDFFVRKHAVESLNLPGRYAVPAGTERLPLFGALGRVYDYAIFPDWGVNVLACHDNRDNNYTYRTTHWKDNESVNGKVDSFSNWWWAQGYLLEMGRFT